MLQSPAVSLGLRVPFLMLQRPRFIPTARLTDIAISSYNKILDEKLDEEERDQFHEATHSHAHRTRHYAQHISV